MATQTLEFNAPSGLTLTCKLFAIGSDVEVASVDATEKDNDINRYLVSFDDIPAGAYRMNAFLGAVGGFANELYDLLLETGTYYPRSELGGLLAVKQKTDQLVIVDGKVDALLQAAVSYESLASAVADAFVSYIAMPFMPVQGDFFIVQGDDHNRENPRGSVGPLGPVTTPLDLLAETGLTLRCGFTQKRGTSYTGETFQGTAYAVATGVPNQYNLYIEVDKTATLDKPAGVYGFDIEAVYTIPDTNPVELAVVTLISSEATLQQSFGTFTGE